MTQELQKRIGKRSHFSAKKVKHLEQANSSMPIQAIQASQEWTYLLFRGLRLLSGESRLLSQRSCQLSGGSRVTSTFRLPLFAAAAGSAAHCYLRLCAVIRCCLLMRDIVCCRFLLAPTCCCLPLFAAVFYLRCRLLLFAAICCCFWLFAIVCCCLPLLLPLARFARNFNPITMAKMSPEASNLFQNEP